MTGLIIDPWKSETTRRLRTIAAEIGATDLVLCLDAGDSDSYGGSGQTWADLSGQGNDYQLGAGSGSGSDDPTFNGSAGGLSDAEYFSFDGGDFFSPVSATSWADAWPNDNATLTIAFIHYKVASGWYVLTRSSDANADVGVALLISPADKLVYEVDDGAVDVLFQVSTSTIGDDAWHFLLVSLDEAAGSGGSFLQHDATVETFDGTYSSPSTNPASHDLQIGRQGDQTGGDPPNGSRLAGVMMWDRALTQGQATQLYNTIKSRRFPTI